MILECKNTVNKIMDRTEQDAIRFHSIGIVPSLAIVNVEGDLASKVYVTKKEEACKKADIRSITCVLKNDATEEYVLECIESLNNDPKVNAIMVQLPLPKHLNEEVIINSISPIKDADCLTSVSIGALFSNDDIVQPCTPKGIMEVLKDNKVDLEGKDVLIINRSMLVGKPLVELLQRENATVTLAHSKTKDLHNKIVDSDIVITAVGKENFIKYDMLKNLSDNYHRNEYKHKYFIDVSINVNKDGKLCGDIEYNNTKDRDLLIALKNVSVTTVPGGIGLTTVASLLSNTIHLTKLQKQMNLI